MKDTQEFAHGFKTLTHAVAKAAADLLPVLEEVGFVATFRPLHDWLLIKVDPIQEKEGSIFLVHGGRVRTATVVRMGPGKSMPSGSKEPIGLAVGARIAFYREHMEHKQGKTLGAFLKEIGDDLALIRVADVLFEMLEEVVVS